VDNPLIVALAITVAGMTLLFLALAFFYGLLSLISAALHDGAEMPGVTRAEKQAAPDETELPAPAAERELMHRAAAIAVALARAEGDARPAPVPAGVSGEPLSPWWSMHQGSRLAAGSSPWRKS
jgi:Na+-transporting methylmalonyl-CoA/oxaloacetate decarboxylase gamma subunit